LRAEGRNQNSKYEVGGRLSRSRMAEDDNSDDGGGADQPFITGNHSLLVTGGQSVIHVRMPAKLAPVAQDVMGELLGDLRRCMA
jgi:hypothetical protein